MDKDINNLPKEVQQDIDNGFIITDIDDNYQRCKELSSTLFHYRSGQDEDSNLVDETIDVSTLSDKEKADAIDGYYDSMDALVEEMDSDESSVNMIIAECYFETEFC